jgi:hypothetical protein
LDLYHSKLLHYYYSSEANYYDTINYSSTIRNNDMNHMILRNEMSILQFIPLFLNVNTTFITSYNNSTSILAFIWLINTIV